MGVAVYPKLSELLRANELSVAELVRQIEQRYGLSVDPKTLYRLASDDPIRRADLQIAGAVAALLGVRLDELFDVRASPVDAGHGESTGFDPIESKRLAQLFDRQARGALSGTEQQELESLVGEYGRQLHERRINELAQRRGISVEQARDDAASSFDDGRAWWQAFEAEPGHRANVAKLARSGRKRPQE